MQPVLVNVSDISQWVARLWWPVLRVGGFVASAPVASEATIPGPVKIALSLGLAFILGPLAPVPPGLSVFSAAGALAAVQEVFIGVAIGMVMRLAFEALAFAGQSVSLTMGLGFARLVDPAHGAETPALGQLCTICGTLAYLAMNGHLALIGALAIGFRTLPIGGPNVDRSLLWSLAAW